MMSVAGRVVRTQAICSQSLRVFRNELSDPTSDLVADAAEDRHRRVGVGRAGGGRVLEAMVDALGVSGEGGAGLACVVADRDDVVELLPDELFRGLGAVPRDVDSDLAQRLDR